MFGPDVLLGLLREEKCFAADILDRKSTRLNSSHQIISYAVFCFKKKKPPMPSVLLTVVLACDCLVQFFAFSGLNLNQSTRHPVSASAEMRPHSFVAAAAVLVRT